MVEPERYYSRGRVGHALSHWHCCLAGGHTPGDCSADHYREPGKRYRASPNLTATSIADLRADLETAIAQLPPRLRLVIPAIADIGPRDRTEHKRDWQQRRLDWWIVNRHKYGRWSPEHYLHLTTVAIRVITRILTTGHA